MGQFAFEILEFNTKTSGVGVFVEGGFHNVFVTGSDFHYIPIIVGVWFGES